MTVQPLVYGGMLDEIRSANAELKPLLFRVSLFKKIDGQISV
jgi:hypothetical protein